MPNGSSDVWIESGVEEKFPQHQIQPEIENGFVKVPAGEWLVNPSQPVACKGTASIVGLKGLIVPDRAWLRRLNAADSCWFSEQKRPFLTRLDALPDDMLHLISAKLLVAPFASRSEAGTLRVIPLNFRGSIAYTDFKGGWVMTATQSRVTRVSLEQGETLTVRPEALVAWYGKKPSGFCPKLSVFDMILPRRPSNLSFSFYGPAIIWFEGSSQQEKGKGITICG